MRTASNLSLAFVALVLVLVTFSGLSMADFIVSYPSLSLATLGLLLCSVSGYVYVSRRI